MRGARAAVVIAIVAGGAARAVAQPFAVPDTAIAWHAPEDCPAADDVRRKVGGYLEHALGAQPFAIVDVARLPDGTYHAELHIRIGGNVVERVVEARDCAQVADAVALVLGMAAQAPAAASGAPAGEADEAGIAARPPPPPIPGRIAVRVRGAADVGMIPGGGLGLDAGIAATRGRIELVASGRWFPQRFAQYQSTPNAGVDVGFVGGAAQMCVHVTGIWPCLGAELESVGEHGIGLEGATPGSSISLAVTAGVQGSIELGYGVRVVIEAGGYFAALRTRMVLGDDVVYDPSLIGARLYVGLEATIF